MTKSIGLAGAAKATGGAATIETVADIIERELQAVIARLRLDAGTKAPISKAAAEHGDLRRKQGYTVAMAVEESRLLQVTIFSTLHKNVKNLEFSLLLPDVGTIADEVDAQLKEQMVRFMAGDAAKTATEASGESVLLIGEEAGEAAGILGGAGLPTDERVRVVWVSELSSGIER